VTGTPGWHEEWTCAWAWAGRCWGGEAFVLVPVAHDGIDRDVLRVLAAYDPDYYFPWRPKRGADADEWLLDDTIADLTRHTSGHGPWDDRFPGGLAGPWTDPGYPLTTAPHPDGPVATELRAAGNVSPEVGLMFAARHGSDLRSKAEGAVELPSYRIDRLTTGRLDSPLASSEMVTPFAAGRFGLGWFTRGGRARHATLVVGDSAADHALGMLLDRLNGPGSAHWAPVGGEHPTSAGVRHWLQDCDRAGVAEVHLTSLTATIPELGELAAALLSHDTGMRINNDPVPFLRHTTLQTIEPTRLSVDGPRAQLADGHRLHLSEPMSFEGGRSLPPTPTPPVPRVADEHPAGTVQWVVDAMIADQGMPARSILTEPPSGFRSAVRPGALTSQRVV
jgi:hypothetical protein